MIQISLNIEYLNVEKLCSQDYLAFAYISVDLCGLIGVQNPPFLQCLPLSLVDIIGTSWLELYVNYLALTGLVGSFFLPPLKSHQLPPFIVFPSFHFCLSGEMIFTSLSLAYQTFLKLSVNTLYDWIIEDIEKNPFKNILVLTFRLYIGKLEISCLVTLWGEKELWWSFFDVFLSPYLNHCVLLTQTLSALFRLLLCWPAWLVVQSHL